MNYFDFLKNSDKFVEFYTKNPQLLKRHQKKFESLGQNEHWLKIANLFVPSNLDNWASSLPKLFDYEKKGYAKLDYLPHLNLLVISYYQIYESYPPILFKRCLFYYKYRQLYEDKCYVLKSIGTAPQFFMEATDDYKLGGFTDYDFFYNQKQRNLTENEYQILEQIPEFKYLPIRKLYKISVYSLLQRKSDSAWLYQIEMMIKIGNLNIAQALHDSHQVLQKKYLSEYRNQIKSKISYKKLIQMITEKHKKEEEQKEKKRLRDLIKEYNKLPKIYSIYGDFIIRNANELEEIKEEGKFLKHCVGSYVADVAKGKTDILFLRKIEDKETPYYTVEIKEGRVIQVRTMSNATDNEMTELVKKWVDDGYYEKKIYNRRNVEHLKIDGQTARDFAG